MNHTKDRRLVLTLSLILVVAVIGMVLSVVGFDRSGLTVEAIAVLMGVFGAAMTVIEVVRSPVVHEQRTTAKQPNTLHKVTPNRR